MISDRFRGLDTLRGCAVLAVLAFHYLNNTSVLRTAWLMPVQDFTQHFFFGVDLFFVLSGFLIGSALMAAKGEASYFTAYAARRIGRIFPLYYLWLGLFVLLTAIGAERWGGAFPWLMQMDAMPLSSFALFTQNFASAQHGTWGPAWLDVTWTLAIEVQFYVLAALVIYLLPLWSVGPFCIAVMIGAEALRQHLGVDHATMVLTQTRIDGPFAGVFAAWLWRSAALRVFVARHGAGLCSAAVALYAAYYVAYTYALARMPITSFAANAILFGFLVIAFTGDDAKPRHAIVRFTRWCGVRCYAIYLFHVGVLGIVSHLMFNWPPNVFPPGAGWPAVVGAALLTFVLVTLSWHYLEKPIMIWAAKLVPRRQAAEMIGSQIDVVTGRPSFPLMSVQDQKR